MLSPSPPPTAATLVLPRLVRSGTLALGVLCAPHAVSQELLFEVDGRLEFDFLGACVRNAGDVDADGHDDVVVGAFGYNALGGRAEVYSGRSGGLLRTFSVIDFSSTTGASGVGDVDGDGHDDVVVGDTGDSTNGPFSGRALVFSGRTGGVIHSFLGSGEKDRFGSSVSDCGDVDGDGRPDVVVGATESANPGAGTGYVRVFSGLDGSLLHEFTGEAPGDGFAIVSGAGDVDADGHPDILVGAPYADGNGQSTGRAQIFSGLTGAALHDLDGAAAGYLFGFAVSGAGDLDDDGHDDFLVGAPGANAGAGEVLAFSGATGAVLLVIPHGGSAIAGGGDLDGDGRPDVLVGRRAYSGLDGSLLFEVQGPDLGDTVGFAGDVDNDCFADIVLGAPIFSGAAHETGKFAVFSGLSTGFDPYCDANPNSTGIAASICGEGSRVVADNDLRLVAFDLPPNQFGYLLASETQGFVANPGGSQGNLCLGGTIGRFVQQIQSSGAEGTIAVPVDLTGFPPPLPPSVQPGETWSFQVWFRDKDPGPTSNFTNGIAIEFE